MNSYEVGKLGKFQHEGRLREGEEERQARKALSESEEGRLGWFKNVVLLFF